MREKRPRAKMRLSTIAIDSILPVAPTQWSGAWVQRRLIDAYATERRLPYRQRRPTIANAWPEMAVEFSDIVGRADDARAEVLQSWEYLIDGAVPFEDIARMEEAHDWLRCILKDYPEERLCLSQWATAI